MNKVTLLTVCTYGMPCIVHISKCPHHLSVLTPAAYPSNDVMELCMLAPQTLPPQAQAHTIVSISTVDETRASLVVRLVKPDILGKCIVQSK